MLDLVEGFRARYVAFGEVASLNEARTTWLTVNGETRNQAGESNTDLFVGLFSVGPLGERQGLFRQGLQTTTGALFPVTPSRNDGNDGYLALLFFLQGE